MQTVKLQILDSLIKHAENADTLDGKHADEFAAASDIEQLNSAIDVINAQLALLYNEISIDKFENTVKIAEIGSTVNSVTLRWKTSKIPTALYIDGVEIDPNLSEHTDNGLNGNGLNLTEYKKWTLTAVDEKGYETYATTDVKFLNGVYYGALDANAPINNDAILGLDRSLQSSVSGTFKMVATAGQRFTFAAPVKYREPTIFNVGGLDYKWEKVADAFEFTNHSGHIEKYNVWMNDEIVVGTRTVKVS